MSNITKSQVSKVATIFRRLAKRYGLEPYVNININPDLYSDTKFAIFIDGDVYSEYWGEGYFGWEFREELDAEVEKLGLFCEPWNKSIIEVARVLPW